MEYIRHGIVTEINDSKGIIRELTSPWVTTTVETHFLLEGYCDITVDSFRRSIEFVPNQHQGYVPSVGDTVAYTCLFAYGELRAPKWTFEANYLEALNKLPRCTHRDGCTNPPRLGKRMCNYHGCVEDEADDEYYYGTEDEDPLAGDVDTVAANYEEPLHPNDAHRLSVMRQHGDYTG